LQTMGRIAAIDFGTKRTGVAITDPLRIVASGLQTVATQDLLPFLQELCARESVEILVVGEPKQRLGNASLVEQDILKFIEQFRALCPEVAIHRFDERFTSKLAMRALIDSGVSRKKRQDKALVDQISATIILQDYLKTHS
jgi:putative holliday junction resolvase